VKEDAHSRAWGFHMAELPPWSAGTVFCLPIPVLSSISFLESEGIDLFAHRKRSVFQNIASIVRPIRIDPRGPFLKFISRDCAERGRVPCQFGEARKRAGGIASVSLPRGEDQTTTSGVREFIVEKTL